MIVKIKDLGAFENLVFGADCFLEYFPEILTTGVKVEKYPNGFYYIVDDEGDYINDTTFFSEEEMSTLEEVTATS